MPVKLTATDKVKLTAKWATTMTKWHIGFVTNGKRLGSAKVKPTRRWQLVGFPGPAGRESTGIVDLLAIRKNHQKSKAPFKRGDFFEIILIQIKGGGARRPDGAKSDGSETLQNITTPEMWCWPSGSKGISSSSIGL